MKQVLYAVEGPSDAPFAEKLIQMFGLEARVVSQTGGSSVIDDRLLQWGKATNRERFLIVRDWDARDDATCAPSLVTSRRPANCPPNVILRIAVRSIEAWLLADATAASSFFRFRAVPIAPESLVNPKLELVRLCATSTSREIRAGMVPRPGSGAAVGPQYVPLVQRFAREHWDPSRAQESAPSLKRAVSRIDQLLSSGVW